MKILKIFISSTFKDMNAERDILIKTVFPRLREKIKAEWDIRLQEVDLRWGVTEEDVKKGEVVDLCLDGIEECKPYFLCMIGKRYGWIPTPAYISRDDYDKCISSPELDEKEKNLLQKTYYLLDNELVYALDRTQSDEIKGMAQVILEKAGIEDASMSITAREINYVISGKEPPNSLIELDKLLFDGLSSSKISYAEKEYIEGMYIRTGAEKIWHLKPCVPEQDKGKIKRILNNIGRKRDYHCFFFFRKELGSCFYQNGRGEPDLNYVESDERPKKHLESLKARIRSKGRNIRIIDYDCYWNKDCSGREKEGLYPVYGLKGFEDLAFEHLWNHMKANTELIPKEEKQRTTLEIEEIGQLSFIESRTYVFYGREEILKELIDSVNKALEGNLEIDKMIARTIVITGGSGSGKSALLAQFYNRYRLCRNDLLLIPRFIGGGSSRSTNPRNLLSDFCEILVNEFDIKIQITDDKGKVTGMVRAPVPSNQGDLESTFIEYLRYAKKKVVIILDGIDQLDTGSRACEMLWLPAELPENVCVVFSALEPSPVDIYSDEAHTALGSIRKRYNIFEIHMNKLNRDDIRSIINSYLSKYGKKLSPEMQQAISMKNDAGSPLYLQMALEELRLVSRHEDVKDFIRNTLPGSTNEMCEYMLSRNERDLDNQLAPGIFKGYIKYLVTGRNGMTEEDLRSLLGKLAINNIEAGNELLPDYYWGSLRRSMRPYMVLKNDGRWDFFHRQLKQSAGRKYLNTEEKRRQAHAEIAINLDQAGIKNAAMVQDLPYHLSNAGRSDDIRRIKELLLDYTFIRAKVNMKLVYELIGDYDYVFCDKEMSILQKTLRQCAHILSENPDGLPSQFLGRLLDRKEPMLIELLQKAERLTTTPWLRPEKQCFVSPSGPLIRTLARHKACDRGVTCVVISSDGKTALTAGDDLNIYAWDIESGQVISSFRGYNSKIDEIYYRKSGVLIMPDNRTAISIYDTEKGKSVLKIWNIDNGAEINTFDDNRTQAIMGVYSTPDGKSIITVYLDCAVTVWDYDKRQVRFSYDNFCYSWGIEISISRNSKYFAAVFYSTFRECPDGGNYDWEYSVNAVDLETGKNVFTKVFQKPVEIYSVYIMPDNKTLIISISKRILAWDIQTGKELDSIEVKIGYAGQYLSYDSNDLYSMSVSHDNKSLLVYNIKNGELRVLNEDKYGVSCIMAYNEKFLITLAKTEDVNYLLVWDIVKYKLANILVGHTSFINSVCLSPDSSIALSVGYGANIKVWDLMSSDFAVPLETELSGIKRVSATIDGKWALFGSYNHTMFFYNLKLGRTIKQTKGDMTVVYGFYISSNGKKAAVGMLGRTEIWNLNDQHDKYENYTIPGGIDDVIITPNGKTVVRARGGLHFLTLKKIIHFVNSHDCENNDYNNLDSITRYREGCGVRSISISKTGKLLLTASEDHNVRAWSVFLKMKLFTLRGHKEPVVRVCISPNGRFGVSGGNAGELIVWDLVLRRKRHVIKGHNSFIRKISISADSKIAYTIAIDDSRLKAWDIQSGALLCEFFGDLGINDISAICNNKIIIVDGPGNVHYLTLVPGSTQG